MNYEARLVSMNEEEAIVAEQVTTYKRTELIEDIKELTTAVNKDETIINETAETIIKLQKDIDKFKIDIQNAQSRKEMNSYKLELYKALIETFNRDYPINNNTSNESQENENTSGIQEPQAN